MEAETRFRATFRRMDESTAAEWAGIEDQGDGMVDALPGRLVGLLRMLDTDAGGFAVSRLVHTVQTAHRAEVDGRDDAYVVCALLHDVGDTLGPLNHAEVAASILRPWVPESYHWMVKYHPVFQGYYFWHHVGGDRHARDALRDSEHYGLTEEFVRLYDMPSFDPDYPTPSLDHYEPLLRRFFADPPVTQAGLRGRGD
ncbi:MAG: HD domain-containing protein [Acidimicrobiales bacterium]